jgi:hypothetical protein
MSISSYCGIVVSIVLFLFILRAMIRLVTNDHVRVIAGIVLAFAIFPWLHGSIMSLSASIQKAVDKRIFLRSADGEISLDLSPLKVPANYNGGSDYSYCQQFSDKDGQSVKGIYHTHEAAYCGYVDGLYAEKVVMVPYKLLPNGKAKYWVGSGQRTIGLTPTAVEK